MADYFGMVGSLGGALIGGAFGAIEGAANRRWNERMYKDQKAYQTSERLAAQEYNTSERISAQEYQLDMWNMSNAYNTPSAQMQRMVQAGINPNNAAAAIGQGSTASAMAAPTPGNSAGQAAPSAPDGGFTDVNPLDMAMQTAMLTQQIRQARSQSNLNDAVARKTDEETTGLIIDNDWKPWKNQADIDQSYKKIQLMEAQGELSHEEASQIRELLPHLKNKTVKEANLITMNIAQASQEMQESAQRIRLLQEQVQTEKHKQKEMDSAAYEAYMAGEEHKSAIEFNGKRMSLTEAEEALTAAQHRYQLEKNSWYEKLHRMGFDPDEGLKERIFTNAAFHTRDALWRVWSQEDAKLNSLNYQSGVNGQGTW